MNDDDFVQRPDHPQSNMDGESNPFLGLLLRRWFWGTFMASKHSTALFPSRFAGHVSWSRLLHNIENTP